MRVKQVLLIVALPLTMVEGIIWGFVFYLGPVTQTSSNYLTQMVEVAFRNLFLAGIIWLAWEFIDSKRKGQPLTGVTSDSGDEGHGAPIQAEVRMSMFNKPSLLRLRFVILILALPLVILDILIMGLALFMFPGAEITTEFILTPVYSVVQKLILAGIVWLVWEYIEYRKRDSSTPSQE